MFYRLCEWEENGYHDSYGYVAFWNDEKNTVECEQFWATAYAGGRNLAEFTAPPTLDVCLQACEWLTERIYTQIRAAEHRNVFEPDEVARRAELVLTRDVKRRGGKLAAGTTGRVFWTGTFGAFFRDGYNKPNRSNTRIGLELNSGERVFVPLAACRRNFEPMSDAELMERARDCAWSCQFGRALSSKFAWDSANWAAPIIAEWRKTQAVAA